MTSSSSGPLRIGMRGAARIARSTPWTRRSPTTETKARFLAEAESFQNLMRFGWSGGTGATPAVSIGIASTLHAIAASSRHGAPADVADQRGN